MWPAVRRNATVRSEELQTLLDVLTGVVNAGDRVQLIQYNNSSNYALDVRNADTTNSYGLRVRDAADANLLLVYKDNITVGANVTVGASLTVDGLDLSAHAHTGAAGHGVQVAHTSLTAIGTNTHAQIDTHVAATSAHGATSDPGAASAMLQTDGSGLLQLVGLGIGTAPASGVALHVIGNYQLANAVTATKAYRFRTSGSDLDVDGAAAAIYWSVYANADFTGTQYFKVRMGAGDYSSFAQLWEWKKANNLAGTTSHSINADGGVIFNEQGDDYDFRVEGVGEANLLFVDASAARVGIGESNPATYRLQVRQDQNASTAIQVQNATAGTGAQAQFRAINDGGLATIVGRYSSTTTAYGALVANAGFLYGSGAAPLVIMADNASADIVFAPGGSAQKARLYASGGLHLGATPADPGANNLKVEGNLRVGNTNYWTLAGWTTNADAAVNGYVTVTIDGTTRKLATIA